MSNDKDLTAARDAALAQAQQTPARTSQDMRALVPRPPPSLPSPAAPPQRALSPAPITSGNGDSRR